MSPKQPLNFAGRRPGTLPAEAEAKLAELESRAEARGNAVAGQAAPEPPLPEPAPDVASSQARKPASPRRRREAPPSAARSGTQAEPYVRATDGQATRSTTVHLLIELHQKLRMEAAKRGEHMSAIIAEAVRMWFGKHS